MHIQNMSNSLSRRLLASLFIILLIACSSYYLTDQSRQIHEELWSSKSILFDQFMENTPHQTPVFRITGLKEGPTVLIIGGTHGNETAGFEAAHQLLKRFADTPPSLGTLFFIPEANRQAVLDDSRRIPVPEATDIERGNLNRCYPGDDD